MTRHSLRYSAALVLVAAMSVTPAFAQSTLTPLQQAEMMDACNGMPILSAESAGNGQLEIRCGRIAANGGSGSLGAAGPIIGGLVGIVAIGALAGGSSSSSTN